MALRHMKTGLVGLAAVGMLLTSCGKKQSDTATGWNYNDEKWGGFSVAKQKEQVTGPNLVLIEGGTFTMGVTEEDITYEHNNIPRRVTVSSFYMDETEISNVNYRQYIHWMGVVHGAENPELVKAARPDTLCWREELAYHEPMVESYFSYPAYDDYPVVGVTWLQAQDYCKWRSDRVNELLLIDNGYLENNPNQTGADNFSTDAYTVGTYQGAAGKKQVKDNNPNGTGTRPVNKSDGILLPSYRLPSEAEWEYAALALKGTIPVEGEEVVENRRIYPWDGTSLRYQIHNKNQGSFMANFKRGRGDYMGVAGALNDNAEYTGPVGANMPNDYGLFNMAGNVSEWVEDVYRPLTFADAMDMNTFRGNVFMKMKGDESGTPEMDPVTGRVQYEMQTPEDLANRQNYRTAYALNYEDGDSTSGVMYDQESNQPTSLISDKSRVYKGGSWNDRAFWLSPGARRYLNEDQSSSTIGFRCAMVRMGSRDGKNNTGNQFSEGKKAKSKNAKARKY